MDLDWLHQKMAKGESFVVLQKMLGLTHPARPFAVSAMMVLVEDEEVLEQILLSAPPMNEFAAVPEWDIPVAFPPAITDVDMDLQRTHLQLALGSCTSAAVVHQTCKFARDLLQEDLQEISDLDDIAMASVLEHAHALVQSAMQALRKAEQERQKSEVIVHSVLSSVIDKAWTEIKLRVEWSKIEARGKEWAFERRTQKHANRRKGKSKKDMQSSDDSKKSNFEERFKGVVHELHTRTVQYQCIASGMVGLIDAGLATIQQEDSDTASHQPSLHGLSLKISPTGGKGRKRIPHSRKHFTKVLDESISRDRELAIQNREELQLKLAMQESLAGSSNKGLNDQDMHIDDACTSKSLILPSVLSAPLGAKLPHCVPMDSEFLGQDGAVIAAHLVPGMKVRSVGEGGWATVQQVSEFWRTERFFVALHLDGAKLRFTNDHLVVCKRHQGEQWASAFASDVLPGYQVLTFEKGPCTVQSRVIEKVQARVIEFELGCVMDAAFVGATNLHIATYGSLAVVLQNTFLEVRPPSATPMRRSNSAPGLLSSLTGGYSKLNWSSQSSSSSRSSTLIRIGGYIPFPEDPDDVGQPIGEVRLSELRAWTNASARGSLNFRAIHLHDADCARTCWYHRPPRFCLRGQLCDFCHHDEHYMSSRLRRQSRRAAASSR